MALKVMVLGASGLLGHAVFRALALAPGFDVVGTVRAPAARAHFSPDLAERLQVGVDITHAGTLARLFERERPAVVVNCAGARRPMPPDPMALIHIFALPPRQIAHLCRQVGARMIQISSDAVFSGRRGGYRETDPPDPVDAYGVAKLLGEVDASPMLTVRTSMIGPELPSEGQGGQGMLAWFLAQSGVVSGYRRAIFSGLTSTELARVLRDVLIPSPALSGVLHVAGPPISKFDLLCRLNDAYAAGVSIMPDDGPVIDRSLDASRLQSLTGYTPPDWSAMIAAMKADTHGLARS